MAQTTLADFARSIGISPATARQWKKRGKIIERDSGFELVAEISADGLKLSGVKSVTGITLHNEPTGESVTAECDGSVTLAKTPVMSVTLPPGVTGCDCGRQACVTCGWRDDGVTDPAQYKRLEDMSRIEVLERDNRILSDAVDSLRDLTTEQGATISQALKIISDLRSRVTALEIANEGRGQDMATLYREMRDRTAALPDPPDWRGTTPAPIDPPVSGWGP